jgi:VWFA-related protein
MKDGFVALGLQCLVLLLVHVGAPLHAQQSGQPQPEKGSDAPGFTLKTTVNRVLVDVTVTDAHGTPVHGLSKGDFVVEEDGMPQRVLSFDEYNFDKGMDYVPPKLPVLPPNTYVDLPADPERGPLYVLLYDLVNIPLVDQIPARAQLVKFIESKPEGARIAIFVSSDGLHLVQGFTSDKAKLLAAVNPNGTGPHVPKVFLMGGNFGQGDKLSMSYRLNSISQYLSTIAGRKLLIWFASDFPLSLFPSRDETQEYQEAARKTLDLFADNQIAVYPVDTSGVVVAESYGPPGNAGGSLGGLNTDSRDEGLHVSGTAPGTPGVGTVAFPGQHPPLKGAGASLVFSSFRTQDAIAQATGGKAIYSSNNLENSLEKVTEDGGSYYSLGYSPTDKNFDGKLRHIEMELKDSKDHLAYRRAYYGVKADALGESPDNKISGSMKHGAPEFHQLVFEAQVAAAGSPARGTAEQMKNLAKAQGEKESAKPRKPIQLQAYTVDYAVMAAPLRAEGDTDPQFQLAVAAFDADGGLLNSVTNLTVKADPAAGGHAAPKDVYRVEQELEAPLDAKFLRFAVRDVGTGRVGAMEIALPLAAAK